MMLKTYIVLLIMLALWTIGLYKDLMQKKRDFQNYLKLQQRYIEVYHQSLKQSVLPSLEWPQLLKVWMAVANINHCELIHIHPMPQSGFRIKIQGTFWDLLQWLYAVHHQLPQLLITKIIIDHHSLGYLQMQIQGYRNVLL